MVGNEVHERRIVIVLGGCARRLLVFGGYVLGGYVLVGSHCARRCLCSWWYFVVSVGRVDSVLVLQKWFRVVSIKM